MQKNKMVVITSAGINDKEVSRRQNTKDTFWDVKGFEKTFPLQAFEQNPQKVMDFYNKKRREMLETEPNEAHFALTRLAEKFDTTIITQNTDNFHERAGSQNVIHLHGELTKVCSSVNKNEILPWIGDLTINDLDQSGHLLRPFEVWYGETVPLLDTAIEIIEKADIILMVGYSISIFPSKGLIQCAQEDSLKILVDAHPPKDVNDLMILAQLPKIGVPKVVNQLLK